MKLLLAIIYVSLIFLTGCSTVIEGEVEVLEPLSINSDDGLANIPPGTYSDSEVKFKSDEIILKIGKPNSIETELSLKIPKNVFNSESINHVYSPQDVGQPFYDGAFHTNYKCKDQDVSYTGSHNVQYHYRETNKVIHLDLLDEVANKRLSYFSGGDTRTDKITDLEGAYF
jgi:hypothetical protein